LVNYKRFISIYEQLINIQEELVYRNPWIKETSLNLIQDEVS
jgi:hypothetical protein